MENKNTAIHFGVLEKCEKLEKELLQIDDVTKVELNLDGFWNDIFQVHISVAYDIPLYADNEFLSSSSVFEQVVEIATGNFLKREGYKVTSDESFDGYHFYFTFDCTEEWKERIKERDVDILNEKTASDVSDSMCLWRDGGKTMVKGSIADRVLECIGYPENWTEQEVEDNKRVIQEEFSKIDSHVIKAVVSRLCDKIEEPKIGKREECGNSTVSRLISTDLFNN